MCVLSKCKTQRHLRTVRIIQRNIKETIGDVIGGNVALFYKTLFTFICETISTQGLQLLSTATLVRYLIVHMGTHTEYTVKMYLFQASSRNVLRWSVELSHSLKVPQIARLCTEAFWYHVMFVT